MRELNGFLIENYNQHKFPDGRKSSTCPFCSHNRKKKTDKCVSLDWELGFYYCNHCGKSGQLHTYKKKEQEVTYVKPKWNRTELNDKAVKWFEGRGISQLTLNRLRVTGGNEWMPQTNKEEYTIKFNYFLNEELVNTKYRDGRKNFKLFKGAEKIFYNIDSIRTQKECIIVEGEIDALSFVEAGVDNVISVPNGFNLQGNVNLDYLDNYLDFFDNKDKIYLALDNDEAGLKGRDEFTRRLGSDRCYLLDFKDCKDANEYLIKYGKEELRLCLEKAELTPLENVKQLSNYSTELDNFWLNGLPKGMLTGMELFDEVFSAELGQYTLITGVPQSGKSEFLDQMIIKYNLKSGNKVGFVSLENEPFIFHYDKITQKLFGRKPQRKDIGTPELDNVKNYINDNYFHVHFEKRYYLEEVLEKFKELTRRKGCRIFVIDPYNKVRLKNGISNINDFTNEYHTQLDAFVKDTNSHLFLVAHPNKTEQADGSESTFKIPNAYNIKGGGEHFDMSYNVLGVNRIYEQKIVQIKTLKVKFKHLGEQQRNVFYGYNTVNGRYTDLDYQPTQIDFSTVINCKELDYSNWLTKKQNEPEQTEVFETLQPNKAFDWTDEPAGDIPF
jgi:twinkle protein